MGATWKNSTCSSEISSSVTQGDVICVEITGSGFSVHDTQFAVLFTEPEHQLGRTPVATVPLEYHNTESMRGKWVAQWLSRYKQSSGNTIEYGISVLGNETFVATTTLEVSQPSRSPDRITQRPPSSSTAESQFNTWLGRLGFATSEIADIRATLWLIYGEGQGYDTEAEFLWEFVQGATYGEWGVRDDPARFGLAYYAGWMIFGFIPGVDIPGDIRDFLALDVTKCSVWDLKCIGAGLAWDAIDLASIIPGVGKIGDGPQAGRIVAKFAQTPAAQKGIKALKNTWDTMLRIFKGHLFCWSRESKARGFCIQDGLFQKLVTMSSKWKDLDVLSKEYGLRKMEKVDFYLEEDSARKVVSAKSLEPRDKTYVNMPGRIASKIKGYADDLLKHPEDKLKKDLGDRGIEISQTDTVARQLDVVVPKNYGVTTTQGGQLKRAACQIKHNSDFDGVDIKIWVGSKKSGSGFVEWAGMQGLTLAQCRGLLN